MKIVEALEILEKHNEWRLSNDIFEGIEFDVLTDAINTVINELKSPKKRKVVQSEHDINTKLSLFGTWWGIYDKKVGKNEAQKKWLNLSFKEIDICLNVVRSYVESKPDKKFRKDPVTYLNQKSWEDEIINQNTKTNAKSISEVGDGVLNRIMSKYSGQNDPSQNESATDECHFEIID